jgi:hypothetical protein
VQDFVAEDHLARFAVSLVTEELDLARIMASYRGERGQAPLCVLLRHLLLAPDRRGLPRFLTQRDPPRLLDVCGG